MALMNSGVKRPVATSSVFVKRIRRLSLATSAPSAPARKITSDFGKQHGSSLKSGYESTPAIHRQGS